MYLCTLLPRNLTSSCTWCLMLPPISGHHSPNSRLLGTVNKPRNLNLFLCTAQFSSLICDSEKASLNVMKRLTKHEDHVYFALFCVIFICLHITRRVWFLKCENAPTFQGKVFFFQSYEQRYFCEFNGCPDSMMYTERHPRSDSISNPTWIVKQLCPHVMVINNSVLGMKLVVM